MFCRHCLCIAGVENSAIEQDEFGPKAIGYDIRAIRHYARRCGAAVLTTTSKPTHFSLLGPKSPSAQVMRWL